MGHCKAAGARDECCSISHAFWKIWLAPVDAIDCILNTAPRKLDLQSPNDRIIPQRIGEERAFELQGDEPSQPMWRRANSSKPEKQNRVHLGIGACLKFGMKPAEVVEMFDRALTDLARHRMMTWRRTHARTLRNPSIETQATHAENWVPGQADIGEMRCSYLSLA